MPDDRDAHGHFKPGSKPTNGLDKRPEDRHKLPTRGRQFQLAATKYLAMTNEEVSEVLKDTDSLTQAELLAIEAIADAKNPANLNRLAALALLLDRVEGRPAPTARAEPEYEPPVINIEFSGMTEEEVDAAIRGGGDGSALPDGDGERR